MALVVAGASIIAVALILFGAVRFLDQAQREHERVGCLQVQVRAQAHGNAIMASAVLDTARPQAERAKAFNDWAGSQASIAQRIEEC